MSYRGELRVVHLDYMEVRWGDCLAVFPAFTSPGPIKLRIFNYSFANRTESATRAWLPHTDA
jgi:hypothetical protein